jgi:hypothetical protein
MGNGVNIPGRDTIFPTPAQLGAITLIRFPLIVREYSPYFETTEQMIEFYRPIVKMYSDAGITCMLVCTHQIGLEGKFNWDTDLSKPTQVDWVAVKNEYVPRVQKFAAAFKNYKVIMQLWNEQDSQDARASVVIQPFHYGNIFRAAQYAISLVSYLKVATGGYNSGADRGRQQFIHADIKPDFVCFHPYGASANGQYQGQGIATLQQQVTKWRTLGVPLIVSEWGALGWADEPEDRMASFISACRTYMTGKVAHMIYFSWYAQDVHPWNSYPVFLAHRREKIYNALVGNSVPPPPPPPPPPAGDWDVFMLVGTNTINIRREPGGTDIGDMKTGMLFKDLSGRHVEPDTGRVWYNLQTPSLVGWVAGDGWGWIIGKKI